LVATTSPRARFYGAALAGLAVLLAFAVWGGDRVGWEGDDLAIMFGATYLDEVSREVYRYAWQPLSYESLHALRRIGIGGLDLTYVGNVAGMIGVWLLIVLVARTTTPIVPLSGVASAVLVLSMPEAWLTSLYFNTTALALPWFAGSMCLIEFARPSAHRRSLLASGLLFGIACLLRLDFAATGLFLLLTVCRLSPAPIARSASVWLAGAAAPFVAWISSDPSASLEALRIAAGYEEGQASWGAWMSFKVAVAGCGPALLVFPLLLWRVPAITRWRVALILSLSPLLLPLVSLYSPKYLIPLFCCVVWLAARELRQQAQANGLGRHWGLRVSASVAIAVLSLFWTPDRVQDDGPLPMRTLFTHDGARTFGGYLSLLSLMRTVENRPPNVQPFVDLARAIDECRADVTVLYPSGVEPVFFNEWNLGWVPTHLTSRSWHLERYEPSGTVELTSPSDGRRVALVAPGDRDAVATSTNPDRIVFDIGALLADSIAAKPDVDAWAATRRVIGKLRIQDGCGG
jgi:hypothetical protein